MKYPIYKITKPYHGEDKSVWYVVRQNSDDEADWTIELAAFSPVKAQEWRAKLQAQADAMNSSPDVKVLPLKKPDDIIGVHDYLFGLFHE